MTLRLGNIFKTIRDAVVVMGALVIIAILYSFFYLIVPDGDMEKMWQYDGDQ